MHARLRAWAAGGGRQARRLPLVDFEVVGVVLVVTGVPPDAVPVAPVDAADLRPRGQVRGRFLHDAGRLSEGRGEEGLGGRGVRSLVGIRSDNVGVVHAGWCWRWWRRYHRVAAQVGPEDPSS